MEWLEKFYEKWSHIHNIFRNEYIIFWKINTKYFEKWLHICFKKWLTYIFKKRLHIQYFWKILKISDFLRISLRPVFVCTWQENLARRPLFLNLPSKLNQASPASLVTSFRKMDGRHAIPRLRSFKNSI